MSRLKFRYMVANKHFYHHGTVTRTDILEAAKNERKKLGRRKLAVEVMALKAILGSDDIADGLYDPIDCITIYKD